MDPNKAKPEVPKEKKPRAKRAKKVAAPAENADDDVPLVQLLAAQPPPAACDVCVPVEGLVTIVRPEEAEREVITITDTEPESDGFSTIFNELQKEFDDAQRETIVTVKTADAAEVHDVDDDPREESQPARTAEEEAMRARLSATMATLKAAAEAEALSRYRDAMDRGEVQPKDKVRFARVAKAIEKKKPDMDTVLSLIGAPVREGMQKLTLWGAIWPLSANHLLEPGSKEWYAYYRQEDQLGRQAVRRIYRQKTDAEKSEIKASNYAARRLRASNNARVAEHRRAEQKYEAAASGIGAAAAEEEPDRGSDDDASAGDDERERLHVLDDTTDTDSYDADDLAPYRRLNRTMNQLVDVVKHLTKTFDVSRWALSRLPPPDNRSFVHRPDPYHHAHESDTDSDEVRAAMYERIQPRQVYQRHGDPVLQARQDEQRHRAEREAYQIRRQRERRYVTMKKHRAEEAEWLNREFPGTKPDGTPYTIDDVYDPHQNPKAVHWGPDVARAAAIERNEGNIRGAMVKIEDQKRNEITSALDAAVAAEKAAEERAAKTAAKRWKPKVTTDGVVVYRPVRRTIM